MWNRRPLRDFKSIQEKLQERGFELVINGSGHYKIMLKGNSFGVMPSSPSDHRAAKNWVTTFRRRHGVDLERD